MDINDLTGEVIGAAIEVHRILGPGLLESIYEECLCIEFDKRKIPYQRQKEIAQVRIYLITDMSSKEALVAKKEVNRIQFSCHVCDINRIYRLTTSGAKREPILIDFKKDYSLIAGQVAYDGMIHLL